MSNLHISQAIENLLVARNPRGMKTVQAALKPGYILRAAELIQQARGNVLIGTGFPVDQTFETDGPPGAIALYQVIEKLGGTPIIVCGAPLADCIKNDFAIYKLVVADTANPEQEARQALDQLQPDLVISIERPGLNAEGNYCNMRGEDISANCASFDHFLNLSSCPTIGIGDGGNEIGMGNVVDTLANLNVTASITCCDELVIADISNWAAHGLIAMLSHWQQDDLLVRIKPQEILEYIAKRGSLDGVTREPTLTEDSLPLSEGQKLIASLRQMVGF